MANEHFAEAKKSQASKIKSIVGNTKNYQHASDRADSRAKGYAPGGPIPGFGPGMPQPGPPPGAPAGKAPPMMGGPPAAPFSLGYNVANGVAGQTPDTTADQNTGDASSTVNSWGGVNTNPYGNAYPGAKRGGRAKGKR